MPLTESQTQDAEDADRHCMDCGHEFIEVLPDDELDPEVCPRCGSDDTLITV